MELRRLQIREALRGQSVSRFMISDPISVSPSTTLDELVDEYVYEHHHKMYPVVEDGRLLGCVTTREVKEVPRREWSNSKVLDIVQPCSEENSISVGSDSVDALNTMHRKHKSRLLVVDGDSLAGIISLKDMLRFISLKMDLEKEALERYTK
jgi:predicted transcriptional regulator